MRAAVVLADAGGVTLTTEGKRGNNRAGYPDAGTIAGDTVSLAQNPNAACVVAQLIDPVAQQPIGVIDCAYYSDLFVHVGPGIACDIADTDLLRTSGQQQNYTCNRCQQRQFSMFFHVLHP